MRYVRVCGILLLIGAGAWCQDVDKEQKKLDGTWTPKAGELSGDPFPEAVLKSMKLVIAGDKYTVTVGDKIDRGTVKLDPAKTPKAMDILGGDGPNKGKTILAIYELKDDTLRVCYDLLGKNRPTEFMTKKGVPLFLVTYERMKP